MDGWVNGLRSFQINKNQINFDLIEIIQFCLKFYDLWIHSTYGWLGRWWLGGLMGGSIGVVMLNQ